MYNSDRFKITKNRFYKYIWAIYNTIAICLVNMVLEKNVRFKGFKLEIKTPFFSKIRRKEVYFWFMTFLLHYNCRNNKQKHLTRFD